MNFGGLDDPQERSDLIRRSEAGTIARVSAPEIEAVVVDALRAAYPDAYWRSVLGGRPLTLVRHVSGLTFFHEGLLPPAPPARPRGDRRN